MQQLIIDNKKTCFKCGMEKHLEDFYKHSQMSDGHLNKCKECTKNDVRSGYELNRLNAEYIASERARGREKHYRLYSGVKTDPAKKKIAMSKYFKKYPEKNKAKAASNHIPCAKGFNKHHWSYNEEHYKDVIIIPASLHAKVHRYIIYIGAKKMYRTVEGTLLDTREKHVAFINQIEQIF